MNQIYQMVWKILALKNFNVNVDADAGNSAIALRPDELKYETTLHENGVRILFLE